MHCHRNHRNFRLDHPWSTWANLPALDVATAKHAQRRHIAYPDDFRCCLERDLAALSPFAVAVDCNLVVIAETAHALAMIFKIAQAAEKSWRRLDGQNQLSKVIFGVKFNDGIEVVITKVQAAA